MLKLPLFTLYHIFNQVCRGISQIIKKIHISLKEDKYG
nr:MAG TPA: hypothetical protein [Caudoviricetes sp.]